MVEGLALQSPVFVKLMPARMLPVPAMLLVWVAPALVQALVHKYVPITQIVQILPNVVTCQQGSAPLLPVLQTKDAQQIMIVQLLQPYQRIAVMQQPSNVLMPVMV